MNPQPKLTAEQGERLRELYRKNFAALVLLAPESVRDEFPDLVPGETVVNESSGRPWSYTVIPVLRGVGAVGVTRDGRIQGT